MRRSDILTLGLLAAALALLAIFPSDATSQKRSPPSDHVLPVPPASAEPASAPPGARQPGSRERGEKDLSRPFPAADADDKDTGSYWASPRYLDQFSHNDPALRISRPKRKNAPPPFNTQKVLDNLREFQSERAEKKFEAPESESTYNARAPIKPTPLFQFPEPEPLSY
jgi:hypothetical protein